MSEIAKQLREEERFGSGHDALEGLPEGAEGVQTFEIHVSAPWKEKYDQVYGTLMQQEVMERQRTRNTLGFAMKNDNSGKAPDTLLKASTNLNRFLIGFFKKNLPDFDYRIAENNYSHRWLRMPPEMHADQAMSIFYPDPDYAFVNTVLYGCEWDLMLFNVLSFSVMNIWYNVLISALVAYTMDMVLVAVRGNLGKQNVASKTMVDSSFLV